MPKPSKPPPSRSEARLGPVPPGTPLYQLLQRTARAIARDLAAQAPEAGPGSRKRGNSRDA